MLHYSSAHDGPHTPQSRRIEEDAESETRGRKELHPPMSTDPAVALMFRIVALPPAAQPPVFAAANALLDALEVILASQSTPKPPQPPEVADPLP